MRIISQKVATAVLVALCLLGTRSALASDWVSVGGNVHSDTTPVCALVLINGQTQFSCDGTGRYDMQVPIDDNGMITVMVFADGFAPFNQIVTPEQAAAYPIDIVRDQDSPAFQVTSTYEPSATAGWFLVSGTINSGTTPVCALALANGQAMFSCAENLGQFSLDAPPDQDGNITLMVFAAGFKPYKLTTQVIGDSDGDGIPDHLDYDDDNDGIFDVEDKCPLDSNLSCPYEITDTVFVDGREWAQVDFFRDRDLRVLDIRAVCPAGNCDGVLKGFNVSGWTWASIKEVDDLLRFYEAGSGNVDTCAVVRRFYDDGDWYINFDGYLNNRYSSGTLGWTRDSQTGDTFNQGYYFVFYPGSAVSGCGYGGDYTDYTGAGYYSAGLDVGAWFFRQR